MGVFYGCGLLVKAPCLRPAAPQFAELPQTDVGELVLGAQAHTLPEVARRRAPLVQALADRAQIVAYLHHSGRVRAAAQSFQKVPASLMPALERCHAHPQRIPGHGIALVRQQGELVFLHRAKNVSQAVPPVGADVQRQRIAHAHMRFGQQKGVFQRLERTVGHLRLAVAQKGIPRQTNGTGYSFARQSGTYLRIEGRQRVGFFIRVKENQAVAAITPGQRQGPPGAGRAPCFQRRRQGRMASLSVRGCVRTVQPQQGQSEAGGGLCLAGERFQKFTVPARFSGIRRARFRAPRLHSGAPPLRP